jgi:hypothetical protein
MKPSKNIHLLPTDKPSRLIINWEKDLCYKSKPYLMEGTQNIYITSDEEIKEGDWVIEYIFDNLIFKVYSTTSEFVKKSRFYSLSRNHCKKIILTTDQDLIKDGVQSIDDEFLEWFVKNPSCEEVEVKCYSKFNDGDFTDYKIIIPKECMITKIMQMDAKMAYDSLPKQEYQSECICDTECKGFVNVKCKNHKQETLEEETIEEYFLSCIKNVLQFGNDAQAIRFMEKYYEAKKEQDEK